MEKQKSWAKALQTFGNLMMALTASANFFIGLWTAYLGYFRYSAQPAGTRWGYIALGLLITIFSVMMFRAFMMLANKRSRGHHYGVIALLFGTGFGLAQMALARSMTVENSISTYITYLTIFTLGLLLAYLIPSVWQELRFYGGNLKK